MWSGLFAIGALGQTTDTIQKNHEVLFAALAANGGVWVAENPTYDATKPTDFRVFIMNVKQQDALKINADIQGVVTMGDTLSI